MSFNPSLRLAFVTSLPVDLSSNLIKWVILVKWSTPTMIWVYPGDVGNCVMNSTNV